MTVVYIGIGSNLGEKIKNCDKAIGYLQIQPDIKNVVKSRWYKAKAIIYPGQIEQGPPKRRPTPFDKGSTLGEKVPDYINGVARVETNLAPQVLLSRLQEIESKLGRVRTGEKWEPRTIDLDILFYGDEIIDLPDLKIPHPELHKRLFVLNPLCDIAPDLIHPAIKKSVKEMKKGVILRP